jgi:hypothetical protein
MEKKEFNEVLVKQETLGKGKVNPWAHPMLAPGRAKASLRPK